MQLYCSAPESQLCCLDRVCSTIDNAAAAAADVGYFLAMVTEGQVHVLNEGDSVVLECSFHADGYSLFNYPVLWRKQQLDEDVQMNIMGNVNEPFAATNRFEVAFTSLAPRYKFELSVLGR